MVQCMAETGNSIGVQTPNVCLALIPVATVPVIVLMTSDPNAREQRSQDC